MFHYFKSKTAIKKDSFEQGFKKAKKSRDNYWKGKIKKLKIEVTGMINEKKAEINWRDKRIAKIEDQLDKFVNIIAHTRFTMIQIKEVKTVEIMQILEMKQEIEKHSDDMESLFRETKKAEKQVKNEIDNYNIKKITH